MTALYGAPLTFSAADEREIGPMDARRRNIENFRVELAKLFSWTLRI